MTDKVRLRRPGPASRSIASASGQVSASVSPSHSATPHIATTKNEHKSSFTWEPSRPRSIRPETFFLASEEPEGSLLWAVLSTMPGSRMERSKGSETDVVALLNLENVAVDTFCYREYSHLLTTLQFMRNRSIPYVSGRGDVLRGAESSVLGASSKQHLIDVAMAGMFDALRLSLAQMTRDILHAWWGESGGVYSFRNATAPRLIEAELLLLDHLSPHAGAMLSSLEFLNPDDGGEFATTQRAGESQYSRPSLDDGLGTHSKGIPDWIAGGELHAVGEAGLRVYTSFRWGLPAAN